MTLFDDFGKRMDIADKDIEEGNKHVSELLTKIKIERVQVREDRKQLNRERRVIADENRLLIDRRQTLDRAWKELKKLKANIK